MFNSKDCCAKSIGSNCLLFMLRSVFTVAKSRFPDLIYHIRYSLINIMIFILWQNIVYFDVALLHRISLRQKIPHQRQFLLTKNTVIIYLKIDQSEFPFQVDTYFLPRLQKVRHCVKPLIDVRENWNKTWSMPKINARSRLHAGSTSADVEPAWRRGLSSSVETSDFLGFVDLQERVGGPRKEAIVHAYC